MSKTGKPVENNTKELNNSKIAEKVGQESSSAGQEMDLESFSEGISGQGQDKKSEASEENLFADIGINPVPGDGKYPYNKKIPNKQPTTKPQQDLLDKSDLDNITNLVDSMNGKLPLHKGDNGTVNLDNSVTAGSAKLNMSGSVKVNEANQSAEVDLARPKLNPELKSAIQNIYNNVRELDKAKQNGRDTSKLEDSENNLITQFSDLYNKKSGEFDKLNEKDKQNLKTLAGNLNAIEITKKRIDKAFNTPGSQNLIPHRDKNGDYEEISQFAKNTESLRQDIKKARQNILDEIPNLIPKEELEEQYKQQQNKPKAAKKNFVNKVVSGVSKLFRGNKKNVTKTTHYEIVPPNNTKLNDHKLNKGINEESKVEAAVLYNSNPVGGASQTNITPAFHPVMDGHKNQMNRIYDACKNDPDLIKGLKLELTKLSENEDNKKIDTLLKNDKDLYKSIMRNTQIKDLVKEPYEKAFQDNIDHKLNTLPTKWHPEKDGMSCSVMDKSRPPNNLFEVKIDKEGKVSLPETIGLKGNVSVLIKTGEGKYCSGHYSNGNIVAVGAEFGVVKNQEHLEGVAAQKMQGLPPRSKSLQNQSMKR